MLMFIDPPPCRARARALRLFPPRKFASLQVCKFASLQVCKFALVSLSPSDGWLRDAGHLMVPSKRFS
eukprot:773271-Prorocentrum_minimum.AAC.1